VQENQSQSPEKEERIGTEKPIVGKWVLFIEEKLGLDKKVVKD
jgi:hypothetical protein